MPVADRKRWGVRIALWIVVLAAFLLALHCDVALMQWRYAVLPEGPQGLLKQVFYGFRDFGQILPIAVTLVIVGRTDRRRWTIILIIVSAQLLGGVAYNGGKLLLPRYRPQAAIERVAALDTLEVEQTWLGWSPDSRLEGPWADLDEALQSFPSGHSAGAFAFAGVLAWFYPRLAGLFWFLAAGCAVSRYLDGVHWLSDCVAGAAIGYLAAWLALRPYVWALPLRTIRRLKGRSVNV